LEISMDVGEVSTTRGFHMVSLELIEQFALALPQT
jgi:hypothetical protein